MNWWMIWLQNYMYKDEIAEIFDPAPKNGKNLLYAFLFFFFFFFCFCRDYSSDTL